MLRWAWCSRTSPPTPTPWLGHYVILVIHPSHLISPVRCNDGSQANYYHDPGAPRGKILINLQGGGACDSIQSCDTRCLETKPALCTARNVTDKELEDSLLPGGLDPWKVFRGVSTTFRLEE